MLGRNELKTIKSAAWKSSAELDAFVASIQGVESSDLQGLLDILLDKTLAADAARQRLRCVAFTKLAEGVPDKRLFASYLKALKAGDRQLRGALAGLLPAVTDISKHAEVCELFRSPDQDLRANAAKVLKEIGGKTVLNNLGGLVGEPNFPGRREAIDLLVPLGGHWAIEPLKAAMEVGKPLEKRQCLRYLGDTQYVGASVSSALQAITSALTDANETVVTEAIGAYCNLATEDQYFDEIEFYLDDDRPSVARAAVTGLARFPGARTILALERKLREGPTDVRLGVVETLETLGTDDALPSLVDALAHKSLKVRTLAGDVLTRLGKAGKVNLSRTIIYLLRTGDVNLRRRAADLARSVSDPKGELWPKLVRFLRDEDWWVRERVMDALIAMAGAGLLPLIAEYLSDPSDVIRRFAVDVFARLKEPKTLGLLVRTAAEDEDWWVRERAIEAIAAVGDERTFPYIVNIMQTSTETRLACLQALEEMKAVSTAPQVANLLSDDDPDVRLKAVVCLTTFDDPSQADAVEALLGDPNPRIQAAAGALLRRWEIAVHAQASTSSLSTLDELLIATADQQGDDLILSPGRTPYLKRLGRVTPLDDQVLAPNQVEALLVPQLSSAQLEQLKQQRDVDFSYEVVSRQLRFRANVFGQLGGMAAVFRIIRGTISDLGELGLPKVVSEFPRYRDGLVLVGGPTGSGKSTTLAAIIDSINRNSSRHIISLEDPIEFLHARRKGLVNQREVGTHMRSAATALRSTLRQDPDVLLVGEMRDLPTISFAVTAAETGHLVFGTLHTVSADTTIDRVINAFPANQQDQVRSMLADSLRAVLCQQLIAKQDGSGRTLAAEVMLSSDAIANLIRKGKAYQIPSLITTSREQGMQSMDMELKRLYKEGLVSSEEAYMRATNKKEFEKLDEEAEPAAGKPPTSRPPARAG